MAYDSRSDHATWEDIIGANYSGDTPWQYARSWNGRGGKSVKRQTARKLRHTALTPNHQRFGKRVYCKCCCTAMC